MKAEQRFLIDTSAWVETLRKEGNPAVRAKVQAAFEDGLAVLCDLVLLELWNGAHGEHEKKGLRRIESSLEIAPTTDAVWALARETARASRAKGLTIPASDLIIAACAAVNGLELIHFDQHFDKLAAVLRPSDA